MELPIDRLSKMETWDELEPLSRWEQTWKSVHFVLRAIRVAHRQHEQQSLADRLVTIKGDWFWYRDESPHGAVRSSFPQDPRRPLLDSVFEGERRRAAALWFAQDVTNDWLRKYSPLQLTLDQGAGPDASPREVIRPLSLVGLIWTHIARHIAGAAVLASCDEGRQMFEPARADAKYCSDACRQKSYRRRKTARQAQG